ncbi:prenyltransferase/squalene oxidase repeat-containing protein [Schlesneria paludicola]|uniref:prenyltransferase/squalene oxidase repeat-containing protein n=1 Tax=Schlesneria paludicola TaxID=360056 RepID=UPI0012F82E4F|nr:prenyltransferase/squalene oxidase repeat-containing protein [Schlesneria paludicola]
MKMRQSPTREWFLLPLLVAAGFSRLCVGEDRTLSSELLTREQWRQLDQSVDRGLDFLATQQGRDGSFTGPPTGQPGITSLCVLAFLSRGHLPNEGPYGKALNRAIQFVLSQQQENGLIFDLPIENRTWADERHKTSIYNHAISGLMLTEVYGMTQGNDSEPMAETIRSALKFTRQQQTRRKMNKHDKGGWRYLVMDSVSQNDSDLSVTAWQVMFLRSARNAEFDVPVEYIQDAMEYVRRAYVPSDGSFSYGHRNVRDQITRAMVGGGILLLSLSGEHDSEMARSGGRWLLERPFDRYNRFVHNSERYHYSAYYCSQAMFQLGGEYWAGFFPTLMTTQLDNQQPDGSWSAESNRDGQYGNVYTTALSVLSLTPPYQILPIYQR